MRLRSLLAAAALAVSSLAAHADPIGISSVQDSLTVTSYSQTQNLWATTLTITNTGTDALTGLYDITGNLIENGTALTLTGVGDYTAGALYAEASNADVFFTNSDLGNYFGAASAGSPTVAQIPAFLAANYLASGQSATFNVDFVLPKTGGSLLFEAPTFYTTAIAPTPEPSSIALVGTGVLGMAGLLRKRCMGA